MSSISHRLVRRTARSLFSFKPLSSPPRASSPRLLSHRSLKCSLCSNASVVQVPKLIPGGDETNYVFPAIFASILGLGAVEVAYAEAEDNKSTNSSIPSDSALGSSSLEDIARKERRRVEDLLKSKKMRYGSYPKFTVAVKGQKVSFKFQVPPACEISQLVANLVSNLGVKSEDHSVGSDMLLRGWDSAVSWQLTLSYPGKKKEGANLSNNENGIIDEGDLCVHIFNSLISRDKAEIEFMKSGSLSPKELEAFVSILQMAAGKLGQDKLSERRLGESNGGKPTPEKTISRLESMGVRIYGLNEPHISSSNHEISWDNIAGYDKQKRDIEDTVVLALHNPEVYDDIARGTRRKFESNRPRAMLFEGPPGTGKTSCARVIASQAGVPLLYVPLEIIMSKYYGESERLLGQVFSLADELSNGAIIFLDEVDSFAVARDSEMHEATRRILSVLLRQIDGFEQDKKVVVIAATNRKQDLDPALVSRFDSIITFDLPDHQTRQEIASQYAKHLKEAELVELATATEGMSGRDIRDVCQHAERLWASKIIRGLANKDEQGSLPPLQEYMGSAASRRNSLLSIAEQKAAESKPSSRKKFQLDLS